MEYVPAHLIWSEAIEPLVDVESTRSAIRFYTGMTVATVCVALLTFGVGQLII